MNRANLVAGAAAHREFREESKERYLDLSRERLAKIVNKKGRTIIFGLIARLEAAFGRLWGIGKPISQCTTEECVWRRLWEQTRTDMLNHGHTQIRALDKEVAEYEVKWLRHHTDLLVVGNIPAPKKDNEDQE